MGKIKLLQDIPVEDKHGMHKGRIFEIAHKAGRNLWVVGDVGDEVALHRHEYEYVKEDDEDGQTETS